MNWYDSVADNFIKKLYETIELLSEKPNSGLKLKEGNNIRTILITKHNRLYYRIEKDKLIIINLIDTRRNPKKILSLKTNEPAVLFS